MHLVVQVQVQVEVEVAGAVTGPVSGGVALGAPGVLAVVDLGVVLAAVVVPQFSGGGLGCRCVPGLPPFGGCSLVEVGYAVSGLAGGVTFLVQFAVGGGKGGVSEVSQNGVLLLSKF